MSAWSLVWLSVCRENGNGTCQKPKKKKKKKKKKLRKSEDRQRK